MSLQRALLLLIAVVLLAGVIPAGIALDHRLKAGLEEKSREDLGLAPRVMAERARARGDVLMMHAKDLASTAGLAEALDATDRPRALRLLRQAHSVAGEEALLVASDGVSWAGPSPRRDLVDATRRGEMPVVVMSDGDSLYRVALAPVKRGGVWTGAAGVVTRLDQSEAGLLAGLTRSSVLFLTADGSVAATTAGTISDAVAGEARTSFADGEVLERRIAGRRYLTVAAPLEDAGTAVFVRDLDAELTVVPQLRRVAAVSAALALVLALVLGALAAGVVARPVRSLARAAERVATGDFEAPLEPSGVREVELVTQSFDQMRRALVARLAELEQANRELADRQARLSVLQGELIQRDRLAAAGRVVAHLAHEIRNPVANVRNCLELIRRRVRDDPESLRFAELAIDELLRMHELAEQMLNLHRPRAVGSGQCDAASVAREVAALARAGAADGRLAVTVRDDGCVDVGIAPEALKQVLGNLVQNAREALDDAGHVTIDVHQAAGRGVVQVSDDGPGIDSGMLARVFDPFVTTKGAVHGVGLGLFVAEGMVRSCGGRITAANRRGGHGAIFRIELPLAEEVEGLRAGYPDEVPA
ncbi:MAG: ATP-binding protein [Gemmatimonadaceae bacterium]